MRREMSPREVVFRQFRSLEKRFQGIKKNTSGSEDLLRLEMFEEMMGETRDLALSMAIEAGPVKSERFKAMLQSGSKEKAIDFVHKHLVRQSSMMLVDGIPPETLARTCLEKLQVLDLRKDFDAEMSRIAREIIDEHNLPAPSWAVYSIETLCREALGIDGRVPDEDEERYLTNARELIRQIETVERDIVPE